MLIFPEFFTAGDTVKFTSSLKLYSNTEYDLSFVIVGTDRIDATGVPDSNSQSDWLTTISATDSNVTPGLYKWQALVFAKSDNARNTIEWGTCEIKPSLTSVSGNLETRTLLEQALADTRAAIKALMANGSPVFLYEIKGRKAQYYTMAELIQLEKRYIAEIKVENRKEKIANGLVNPNYIRSRFYRTR